jgi:S1-C subfamily serine protease
MMRRLFVVFLGAVLAAGQAPARVADDAVRGAIVKIYTIFNSPDYYNPWSMRGPAAGTGSGCVISGRRILSNAHVVGDQTFIQVRRYGEARRYPARVLSVAHDADLALLTVDDEKFFEGIEPLDFGELPDSQDEVLVYGFPMGGDTLSITKGVISRIEHQFYSHSSYYLLAGQIDAAINPGNSGGPVIKDGRIAGVVMQAIAQADNIGYMVPVNIVRHFFDDIADGSYDGFPSAGIAMQGMENPDLKRKFKMSGDETGMLVNTILPGSPADGVLATNDVLLEVAGVPIADDGTVEFRPLERTSVGYLIQQRQVGDSLEIRVLRDGAVTNLALKLHRAMERDQLIPFEAYDRMPTYFIYGGIVFCPLSKNLLKAWGPNWFQTAPNELAAMTIGHPEVDGEEVILGLKVLPADVNQGYHMIQNVVIEEVDGRRVRTLRELVAAVEAPSSDAFITFKSKGGMRIVLDRAKVRDSQAAILKTYRIPQDRSEDLAK